VVLLLILGTLTWQQAGTYANAETLWQTTLRKNPDCALAAVDLGQCYFLQDHRVDDAIALDRRAIQLDPGFYEAWNNLGVCLAYQGLTDQAMSSFRQALKINPGYENSTVVLAALLNQTNNYAAAIGVYQDALKSNPDLVWARDDLAWLLATCPDARFRDGHRAVNLAEHACQLTHYEEPAPVRTLSAAYAEAGQFSNAVDSASLAEQLFAKQGNTPQALTSMKMLSLFQAGQPYREPPLSARLQGP
jgi:tetratricopeptide (TPR) repeat protein